LFELPLLLQLFVVVAGPFPPVLPYVPVGTLLVKGATDEIALDAPPPLDPPVAVGVMVSTPPPPPPLATTTSVDPCFIELSDPAFPLDVVVLPPAPPAPTVTVYARPPVNVWLVW
jgi:hypothetical protein